ncbi:hypothetical protein J8I87_11765 [Paraburkholderia sp. LEh10]|uniref:hypothetical protein n=1 Tax=Paraburkholderia sp. LEh10 TaxID=2821353 RepID=UPI001AE91E6D|nr:hypothetical protein [Paraburkholderia sp. LEh10]MBP0590377.1 hypothetical protein [Paraburkholderia sp. LEh10]
MLSSKLDQVDTTKFQYSPRNLLEFVISQRPHDNFIQLLTKHNKSLEALIKRKSDDPKITEAIFIIELNKFDSDLIKIANLCAEINSETRKHQENMEKSRETLKNYDLSALTASIGSLYRDARNYDNNYEKRRWLPKLDGKPFSIELVFLINPFHHDPNISNEQNICTLIASFKLMTSFLKTF